MSTLSLIILVVFLASAAAFTLNGATAPARMSMMFGMGKKTQNNNNYAVGKGTANKGTYVPDGLTPEQYAATLKAEQSQKLQQRNKFPKGKQVETLTEWMEEQAKKGYTGKDLLTKGHRMVKAKYPEFYVDKNEQIS